MWYFAWMLGVSMAVLLAIVNTMMCDAKACAIIKDDSCEEV